MQPGSRAFSRALYSTGASPSGRVVATGLGLVTCLGVGVHHVWKELFAGKCGIRKLDEPVYASHACRVAGTVPRGKGEGQLDLEKHFTKAERKDLQTSTCYALVAAQEALEQAGWFPEDNKDREQTGVAVGMGMVDLEYIANMGYTYRERGYRRVTPHFIPQILINMAAGHISLKFGFKGPNHAVSTACTTAAHSIGDAARFIQRGDAKVMVCGGTEASVTPLSMAGFDRMRALCSSFNDSPTEASRPFDVRRDGFVMSEGAGIVVLEDYEHARQRNAQIYGEILGYGLSADAHHITAPCEDGDGAYRCMLAALSDAQIHKGQVGYINAHATSTPRGDDAECCAISRLFGSKDNQLTISSTKSSVGHLLGATGSVEAIFTLLACQNSIIPPTLNCHNPDAKFKHLDFCALNSKPWRGPEGHRRIALTNSFGFGGTNASLCVASVN